MTQLRSKDADVVIVGGGIVGAVQSLLLAQQGFAVLLIEATEAEAIAEPLQQRSVALSHRSYELLEAQGLWPADAVCSIDEIHVTNRGSFGSARITARDLNTAALGFVVANHSFEQHLRQLVRGQKNIEVLRPATASLVTNTAAGVELRVAAGRASQVSMERLRIVHGKATTKAEPEFTVHCNLLIAADGTHSQIRQSLGLGVNQRDYDQVAVVANVECQYDHDHIAHERFTDSGPLALLPLSPRCMAMVYTARERDGEALKAMSDKEFLQLLQVRFGGKLGRFKAVGRRAVFPLALIESESQTVGSCVLIGNSARTMHPVAGQGLNLALRDVFALAACVGTSAGGVGADTEELPGTDRQQSTGRNKIDLDHTLVEFERQRRQDQRRTVRRTDLLARVFSTNTVPVIGSLRGAGLVLLDGIAPLRKRFALDSAGIGVPLGRAGRRSNKKER